MTMQVHEQYKPITVPANTAVAFDSNSIGGFIAKTDGTVTVATTKGTTIVDAMPVTAGNTLPLPFRLPDGEQTGVVTTAGGASGIFCVR